MGHTGHMALGCWPGQSSALPRWCSRSAPWSCPPSRASSASRAPSGHPSRRSERPTAVSPMCQKCPWMCHSGIFPLSASLHHRALHSALTAAPQELLEKGVCAVVMGKDSFLHLLWIVGWEIKLHSLWVISILGWFLSLPFHSFTQNANGSSRNLHNTKDFFHVCFTPNLNVNFMLIQLKYITFKHQRSSGCARLFPVVPNDRTRINQTPIPPQV